MASNMFPQTQNNLFIEFIATERCTKNSFDDELLSIL